MHHPFGWSLPPGVSLKSIEDAMDDGPCMLCGKPVDDCVCPPCKVCGMYGDPACYTSKVTKAKFFKNGKHVRSGNGHGMEITQEQIKLLLELQDQQDKEDEEERKYAEEWLEDEEKHKSVLKKHLA